MYIISTKNQEMRRRKGFTGMIPAKMKAFLKNETNLELLLLVVSGVSLVADFFCGEEALPFPPAWIAVILCGVPILKEACTGLFTRFDIKADVLVSMALIASVAIDEIFAAGEVAFIMQIGAFLEQTTVAKARAGIEKLVHLTPRFARLLANGQEKMIPAEEVEIGSLLRVLPGETVPVDGVVVHGETSIDQSVVTGESIPVDKHSGDVVFSGTVNCFGSFDMQTTRRDADSSIQRMIRLVHSADAGKARIVRLADRWATWIVVIALGSAGVIWYATGEVIRAVTVLVVFCPCALVLATPTAIMAAIGNATRHGILIREGDALERLAAVRNVVFDKTGTLTSGEPRVSALCSLLEEMPEQDLFLAAASAELRSEHPLGKALVASCRERYPEEEIPEPEQFEMYPGRGVAAHAAGKRILAGSPALLRENGIELTGAAARKAGDLTGSGATVIYVAINGKFGGLVALSDTIREQTAATIEHLKQLQIRTALLTGDNPGAARTIAERSGIEEVHAGCLPETKLEIIGEYQHSGIPVCMIGDGINDAPALKKAHVGIAMGGIGSDIAVDAADIVLVNDDLRQLPWLLRLARRMMVTIKVNLTFSMLLNFVAILLAGAGILNPVVGALVHNAGSVLVIVNSALLLTWRGGCRSPRTRLK